MPGMQDYLLFLDSLYFFVALFTRIGIISFKNNSFVVIFQRLLEILNTLNSKADTIEGLFSSGNIAAFLANDSALLLALENFLPEHVLG